MTTFTRITSLSPYPSLSFYIEPDPISTPISARPSHLSPSSMQDDCDSVDLIHLLRQKEGSLDDTHHFSHENLSEIISKVEKLIRFNVFSARIIEKGSVDGIKDIHLQSEAGQIHLLRIASPNYSTSSISSLKVEYQLQTLISTLDQAITLTFDKPVGASWEKDEKDHDHAQDYDGLVWTLFEVRGGNASVQADWEELKDDSKLNLLASIAKILSILHRSKLTDSISSMVEGYSATNKESKEELVSNNSYIRKILSTILEINDSSISAKDFQNQGNESFENSQRGRVRRVDQSQTLSSESNDSSSDEPRSDSAVAGLLGSSPKTYRNEEFESKLSQEIESNKKLLNLIMKSFEEEGEGEMVEGAHLMIEPKQFFSSTQILINPPSQTSLRPKPTRIISFRPFRSIEGLRIQRF